MDDVAALAHRNLGDFTRFVARLEPGATVLEAHGVIAASGPGSFPTARQAIRADMSTPGTEAAAAIAEFYDAHGRTGTAFARVGVDDDFTDALVTHGFQEWAQTPEMVCDRPLEARADAGGGAEVHFAATAEDVATYARIAGEAFVHLGIPADITRKTLDNPEVVLRPDVAVALASVENEPVAGAMVVLCGAERLGYVAWVSCTDAARGHGLGDVVTRAVHNEAFARGAKLCTLEASQFGEHTYTRMGYTEVYRYRIMIRI